MPSWVKNESLWARATKRAAAEGHANDYDYITAVYKRMGGKFIRKSALDTLAEILQKAVVKPEDLNGELPKLPAPTESQKEAGNYPMHHVRLHGLNIALENPRGSVRSGVSGDGKKWETTMPHHYGYVKKTEGSDGDHVDVFIGPDLESETVFVVDQIDPRSGKFDEHKCMLCFRDRKSAEKGYRAAYDKNWKGMGAVTEMSIGEFREWLKTDTTRPADSALERLKKALSDF